MKTILRAGFILGFLILCYLAFDACTYSLSENETAIITQFGQVTGKPVTESGLHYKMPFVQTVNRLDGRLQEWDGKAVNMSTGDKCYMIVDAYSRWKISEPSIYFTSIRDTRTALSRLDDIVGSQIRDAVANNRLIEIVRTEKNRKPVTDGSISDNTNSPLPSIEIGRRQIEKQITEQARTKLREFGIELEDVSFMRINYQPAVIEGINNRMISERQKIAKQFRSEGEGEAEQTVGRKNKELIEITSEAEKTAKEIRGEAEATAADIYAAAYNQSPQAAEMYAFLQTMDTYKKTMTNDTTLIMTSKSDLFKYLKSANPKSN